MTDHDSEEPLYQKGATSGQMAASGVVTLTLGEFVHRLCRQFQVEEDVEPDASLYDDLGLDSFAAMMLVLWIEAIAAPPELPSAIPPLFTVRDAYYHYVQLTTSA